MSPTPDEIHGHRYETSLTSSSLILYYPIFLAGLMLAEAGKSEYLACVAGLKQYSISFGHLWELAEEVEHVYTSRWRHPFPSNSSLSHLLLAPAGHLGPMGPWGLDGPVRTASSGSKDGSAMASGSGSGLVSRSYTDGGMGREEWHVTGAGAVLVSYVSCLFSIGSLEPSSQIFFCIDPPPSLNNYRTNTLGCQWIHCLANDPWLGGGNARCTDKGYFSGTLPVAASISNI